MKSSRKINYSTRVEKNIERKMIRDILTRFGLFHYLSEYTYVGFGSKYFTDYLMFHKYLHINSLISIEGDIGNKIKYEFNKPLNCIVLKFGMSNDILPTLKLDPKKIIAWLDYDGLLDESCLTDVATMMSSIDVGSVFMISYNSRPLKQAELDKSHPEIKESERSIHHLRKQIGESYIPHDFEPRGLAKWDNYSKLLRKIVINCMNKRLLIINQGDSNPLKFKQIMNFSYKDGCEMSTLGFTFYRDQDDLTTLNNCKLDTFDFYRDDDDIYEVNAPNLTLKEVKALMEHMPTAQTNITSLKGIIPPSEIQKFIKLYKYLPLFSDAELA